MLIIMVACRRALDGATMAWSLPLLGVVVVMGGLLLAESFVVLGKTTGRVRFEDEELFGRLLPDDNDWFRDGCSVVVYRVSSGPEV